MSAPSKHPSVMSWLKAIVWAYLALGIIAVIRELGIPWTAGLGVAILGAWIGLAFRQAWVYPRHLHTAESLWREGAAGPLALEALEKASLARGELGYRIQLLRSLVYLEMGDRSKAWQASFKAGLVRLPFWQRWSLTLYLLMLSKTPLHWRSPLGEFLGRRLHGSQRFHHFLAAQRFRSGQPDQAWPLMEQAFGACQEDVLVMEDLMLSSLERLQTAEEDTPSDIPARLFAESLRILMQRHGDERCAWNRIAPLPYLLSNGRAEEALALARSLPETRRPKALWEAESIALRDLGNLGAAEQVALKGVERHPDSFRLWMEVHGHALQRRDDQQALRALLKARPLLEGQDDPSEAHWEWMLRRAEFAYWVEGDAPQAWSLLSGIPQSHQGRHHPPFRLQLQVATGQHAEAMPVIEALLVQHPQDLDLLLLQADCLAGMGAWEALRPFLESFRADGATRSDYWHLLGLSHAHLQHRVPARECLERATAMDPHQLRLCLDAGHACMELAEWERAEYHWRRALQIDPQCEESLLQLSETRRALHDPAGAKAILRECLLTHPESEEAQGYLAELEAN
ncbi:MAG: Tetratricopeptide repeat [Holophagaceae bacterium]|nr:Tetratricopeptide repeat [Holophagaceae bacterium]